MHASYQQLRVLLVVLLTFGVVQQTQNIKKTRLISGLQVHSYLDLPQINLLQK
jgi:hypothetical protein